MSDVTNSDVLAALSPAYASYLSQMADAGQAEAQAANTVAAAGTQEAQRLALQASAGGGMADYAPIALPSLSLRRTLFVQGWTPTRD